MSKSISAVYLVEPRVNISFLNATGPEKVHYHHFIDTCKQENPA